MESFFSLVDRVVGNCGGAHIRNRLELARAKMNHLYEFLLSFSFDDRMKMVSKAYSNATTNRGDVILEEDIIISYHRITIETRNQLVRKYNLSI